jgi:gluconokinase
LDSQFKTLEPPESDEHVITAPIDATVETIVENVVRQIRAGSNAGNLRGGRAQ